MFPKIIKNNRAIYIFLILSSLFLILNNFDYVTILYLLFNLLLITLLRKKFTKQIYQKKSELDQKNIELDQKKSELENVYTTNNNERFYYPKNLRFNSNIFKDSVISFAQQGEDLVLLRLLRSSGEQKLHHISKTYVDAGSFHPTLYNNTYILHQLGWRGVNIDISKESIELFNKYRPKDVNLLNAVTSKDNEILRIPKIIENLKVTNSIFNFDSKSEMLEIKTVSLKQIFDKFLNNDVGYLNIDIEGAEIEALQGIDFTKCSPEIISIEIHHKNGTKDALKSKSAVYLKENGYKCVANTAITYFFVLNHINFPSKVKNSN